jgi:hypothetical protein
VTDPQTQIALALRRPLLDLLPKQSVGAEIGVHKGDFSAVILDVVSPSRLHLIDPWHYETADVYDDAWYGGRASGGQAELDDRYRAVLDRFADEIGSGQVVVHRNESAPVLRELPSDTFDWVYIDGNHLYQFVKLDLELSLERTKVGGLITGDDYREGGWWDGGVKRAVDEFSDNAAVELLHLDTGQFVFRKLGDRY